MGDPICQDTFSTSLGDIFVVDKDLSETDAGFYCANRPGVLASFKTKE